MDRIPSDLKLVFRQLRKSPGFTATAVLMLAFGIGATTAIFSIVEGVLLRPLPFPDANRLVTLGDQVSGTDWGHQDPGPLPAPRWSSIRATPDSFQSLGGYRLYELRALRNRRAGADQRRAHDALRLLRARRCAAHGPCLHRTGRSAEGSRSQC